MISVKLRTQFKNIRKNVIDRKSKDSTIFNKTISLDGFKNSNTIGIYISTKDEVSTLDIISYALSLNKIIVCPKIIEDKMYFYKINNLDELTIGKYDILEPVNNDIYEGIIDIMFIPGVIFDKENNRVGMGKGYYDRYLADNSVYKVGLAYKEQIVDKLDVEAHDVKMDLVITD